MAGIGLGGDLRVHYHTGSAVPLIVRRTDNRNGSRRLIGVSLKLCCDMIYVVFIV